MISCIGWKPFLHSEIWAVWMLFSTVGLYLLFYILLFYLEKSLLLFYILVKNITCFKTKHHFFHLIKSRRSPPTPTHRRHPRSCFPSASPPCLPRTGCLMADTWTPNYSYKADAWYLMQGGRLVPGAGRTPGRWYTAYAWSTTGWAITIVGYS